jgi:DNA-binding transcriptional regulator YhcF (GntR family)
MDQPLTAKKPIGPQLGQAIKKSFADGKWHAAETIIASVEGDPQDIKRALEQMRQRGSYHSKCESKKVGTATHYRIFPQEKMVSTIELAEKLKPIIAGMKEEGKKSAARLSTSAVLRLGILLERLLDEWKE